MGGEGSQEGGRERGVRGFPPRREGPCLRSLDAKKAKRPRRPRSSEVHQSLPGTLPDEDSRKYEPRRGKLFRSHRELRKQAPDDPPPAKCEDSDPEDVHRAHLR